MTKMDMEEFLTAAERKSLKKKIRTNLIDDVYEQISDESQDQAIALYKNELKSLKSDAQFMSEIREMLIGAIKKEASEVGKRIMLTEPF